jgi:exosortase
MTAGWSFSRRGWTPWHVAGAAVMAALAVAVTWDAWADMFNIARREEEASHIFLVLPIAAWLVWVRRSRLRYCQPRSSLVGPALVGLGWLISTWGYHNSTQSFWHLGAVMVVVGAVLAVLGPDILKRFLPAFLVLVFLVPVPGMLRMRISHPLMTATAVVTQNVSEVLGVPVQRSGNTLIINDNNVAIAEACNGLRMVFALALVSYAFAFSEPLRGYVRVLILAASPLSAIVCNVIRMVPTLWMYGYGSQDLANTFHDLAGWVMLVVAFLLLMGIVRILRWAMVPVMQYTLAAE